MTTKNYTFGTDPEVFLWDVGTNLPISAHDLVPGTKENPFPTEHGFVQHDGVAAEFNIHPAKTPAEFAENVMNVMNDLRSIVKREGRDILLLSSPTITFDKEYFSTLPADVQALGCMPDYNAWTLEINDAPDPHVDFRSGGFHLVVGWTENESVHNPNHFSDCAERVRQLEAAIFPASLLWDVDSKRRKLYGQMGAFRPKPYGVEWRSLSNAILRYREDGMIWLVDTASKAMQDYDSGFLYIEDENVRNMLANIAGDNVTEEELIKYTYDYLPMTKALEPPLFIGKKQ